MADPSAAIKMAATAADARAHMMYPLPRVHPRPSPPTAHRPSVVRTRASGVARARPLSPSCARSAQDAAAATHVSSNPTANTQGTQWQDTQPPPVPPSTSARSLSRSP